MDAIVCAASEKHRDIAHERNAPKTQQQIARARQPTQARVTQATSRAEATGKIQNPTRALRGAHGTRNDTRGTARGDWFTWWAGEGEGGRQMDPMESQTARTATVQH